MSAAYIAIGIVEITLFLVGLGVCWRVLRAQPSPLRAEAPSSLPLWNIPGYVFGFSIVRILITIVGCQLLARYLLDTIPAAKESSASFGLILGGLGLQIGLLLGLLLNWALLKSQRLNAHIDASMSPGAANAPVLPPLAWWRVPLAGLATFATMVTCIGPLTWLWPRFLEKIGITPQPQPIAELFLKADSTAVLTTLVCMAVVLAPLAEELVFRLGVFRYVRGRLPRWLALLFPAVFFSAIHASAVASVPLLVFGVIQAIAYERTGRIAVPMIAHALFNLHTVLFLLAGDGSGMPGV